MSAQTDINELRQTLSEIKRMLGEMERQLPRVKDKAEDTALTLKETEYIMYRVTSMFRKFGLPDNVDMAVGKMQQVILTMRALYAASMMLQTGGTYGLVMGLLNLMGALLPVASIMEFQRPAY
jgi:hypothetical protein